MSAVNHPDTAKDTTKVAIAQNPGRCSRYSESIQKTPEEEGSQDADMMSRVFNGTRALSPLEVVKRTREGLPASVISMMSVCLAQHLAIKAV